jgi:alpha-L-fucosidase 2
MNCSSTFTQKRFIRILVFCACVSSNLEAQKNTSSLTVRFHSPARSLEESLLTGNGRLGASMYGGIANDRISLNESSMWSGSPHDSDRPDAYKSLSEIRRLLLSGKNAEAEALVNKNFTSADAGSSDPRYGCYQELGRISLSFDDATSAQVSDYSRTLDLDAAVATTSFTKNGVRYTRELFTSEPDQVVVLRLTASKPGALSFIVGLSREARASTHVIGSSMLQMRGTLDSGVPKVAGVAFLSDLKVLFRGGKIEAEKNDTLHVTGADQVLILLTAATNYAGFAGRHTDNPESAAALDLERAATHSYPNLLARHQADFRAYFRRVVLHFRGGLDSQGNRTTADRLALASAGGRDPELVELEYQFGRYLLISSSRPGGLPANLQGLWTEGVQTPWNGDWHLNINVEMNYWLAESSGLGDLTGPLFALIAGLQGSGAHTAKSYYDAPGWVAHIMTNAWGFTSPGEDASWGSTIIGSAWLCQHIWNHYLYTGDKTFLREMYPILRGASEFYLAMLVVEPRHGWLVTAPSNSPENSFYLSDGRKASVCMGPAIDEEILHFLFAATAQSAEVLNVDGPLRAQLLDARSKLAPLQIGPDGRLMEWLEPYREVDPHHRHVSHLWALYPGDEIDPETTPDFALAAKRSLEVRGDGATGWSLANKMLMWTRLGDGDHAYVLLRHLWSPVDPVKQNAAGSFPNLLVSHPPFQMDGNFGATAAIGEMLLNSRPDELRLLPALPSVLSSGDVEGLTAEGGLTASIKWKNGLLVQASLHASRAASMNVEYAHHSMPIKLRAGESRILRSFDFNKIGS